MAGQELRGEYAQHTPGPWHYWDANPHDDPQRDEPYYVVDTGTDALTICEGAGEANARLIAAAPDLMAALEAALSALETPDDLTDDERGYVIEDAAAAIAKARVQ